jgi:hypothetical protein
VGEGYKVVSHHQHATRAVTYGVRNESEKPLEITLDLSQSENLTFSAKGPLVKKVVKPKETQFMMHTLAGVGDHHSAVKHSAKEPTKK